MLFLNLMSRILIVVYLITWALPSYATYKHQQHHNKLSPNLSELWTVETDLSTPESVVYDKARDVLYVSNIAGRGSEKDGIGYISRISTDGEVLDAEWVNGLDAPKGLAIFGNRLFVSDIDRLIEIDIDSGDLLNVYPAQDAIFLNDVAIDRWGVVYVSDSSQNRIYRLRYGSLELWLDDERISNPNGIYARNGRLIVAAGDPSADRPDRSRYLLSVNIRNKHIRATRDTTPIGALDGVEKSNSGGYFITDFRTGDIFHYTRKDGATILVTPERGSADIEL